jgi:hypothetical protein
MSIAKYLGLAVSVYVATVAYTFVTMPISAHLALTYWKLTSKPTLMDKINGILSTLFTITTSDTRAVQVWTKSSTVPFGLFGAVFNIVTIPFQFISQSSLAGWIYSYAHNVSASMSSNTNMGIVQTAKRASLFERIATFFSSQNFTFFVPLANATSTQLSVHIPHWSEHIAKSVGISVGMYLFSHILANALHAVSRSLF